MVARHELFKKKYPEDFDNFGCGPGGVGDYVVPDTVYGLAIKEACQIHDWDYRHSPGASSKHRKRRDKVMFNNALTIVAANLNTFVDRVVKRLRYRRVRFYYKMVRRFGARSYWGERDMDIVTET